MRALLACLLITGCSGGSDTGKTDTNNTNTAPEGCEGKDCYVFVDQAYVGDTQCFDGVNWLDQQVGAGCVADLAINGVIEDFEKEEPVGTAYLEGWSNDDITSSPDVQTQADDNGNISVSFPSCTPIAYKTFTPADMGQEGARDTYEVHQTYGFSASGTSSETYNSVAQSTATLITALIGVAWDYDTTAVIAGTAYDCGEVGIANAQVYIHDSAGNPPTGTEDNPFGVFYFANGLPTDNANQPWTNTDGLWVGVNVPAGDWIADMYGWDGTQHVLLGSTNLRATEGSVYISNIYAGIDDGIWYPESCLAACE